MDCSACGFANRETAKFCAQCASPLARACPSCGSELSPAAKFCDQCGTPADAAPAPAAPPPAPVTRRVVTVLFADLVGSTSFGEQVDAESAHEVLADYHVMARDVIEAAGGSIAKFIGDGVMAIFGAPEIAEDDADRAVAAGVALQRGFAPIRDRVADRHGARLRLRVGVNTGDLVLADGDTDVVGDAVNTAARLEAACTPGEVLVGEDTWRLTRSHVRYEVLGEVEVKGKDRPVATYQVVDEEVTDDQATPFVGRTDELARLREIYDDAVAKRGARLVTVIGSPGVGKTRIAREFCESAGDDAAVAVLRCERAGTATFAPVADLLRSITSFDDDAGTDAMRATLRELVADLDDADRIAELLTSFVGATPARSTEEAFLAVRRLVEATGRRQPLVVVVDDIQWAEPLFLDLLEHLADWVTDAPAMIIGLARPELRELRPSLSEQSRTVAASIGLEGLDADATAELAARLVGAESLPSDLIARLPDSTEGNPLFVRELMRMLVDDGVIEESAGGWQLTIDADAVEVPPTIQSLLAARLDRMPADERRLVELASVVGPEFALGAVAAISDEPAGELRLSLERLRRRELVESTGMYWGDEPIYRFHHVLIRDAAYRRLLKRTRAELHQRVGEWTERTAAGLPGEHEVAIGYHFEHAHEYRRQLGDVGDDVAALGRQAAELFAVAAERSLERDDLPAAAGLTERALARLEEGDASIPALLIVSAEAVLGLGDVVGGRPVVERLSALVVDDERRRPWADAFGAQLTMLTEPDRLRDADEQADRAAARLAELGDEAGVAKARLVRAGALARLGRIGECETELDEALTAARSAGDRRRAAAVLGAAPLAALWGPSPIPRAGGRCLDVIRLLRITTGSPAVEATSVRCQAVLEALRGRFDTARKLLTDSRATVEELGLRHALGETDLFTGIVELLAGDPVAAEAPLRRAYDGLGRLGIGSDAGQAAANLARSLLQQGRIDDAEQLAAKSAELAGENPRTAIAARSAQAEILAAQGRLDEAVAMAQEAVARAEGTDIIVDHAAASSVLAQVAGLAGDAATAERAAGIAADLYEQKAATVAAPTSATAADRTRPMAVPADQWNRAARLTDEAARHFMRDDDEFFRNMAEDAVLVDHRPMVRTETRGRDQIREVIGGADPLGRGRADVTTIAQRGDDLVLVRWSLTWSRGRDGPVVEFLQLGRWNDDDVCDLSIHFEPDDLDAAIVELERLHREGEGGDEHVPWNEADRLTRRFVELFTASDRDQWLAMLSPGQETIDWRPLVGVDTSGADGVADAYPRDEHTNEMTSTVETLAVRGETHALIRWKAVSGSGREWDSLHLTRWTRDGLNDLNVILPPDRLDEAVAELERLYAEQIGNSLEALTLRELALGAGRILAGDVDGFLRFHDPAFEIHDHRQIGWSAQGYDEWRERLDTPGAIDGRVTAFFERLLRHDSTNSACGVQRIAVTTPGGSELVVRSTIVMVVDPYTGLITRMEQFDEHDVDRAVACFDERVAERGPVLHNEASMRAAFVNGWMRRGDDDLAAEAIAPDAEFLDEGGEPFELAPVERREVMAVRGDRLALVHVSGPGHAFHVEEIDEHGRLSSIRRFPTDELTAAVVALERRSLQQLGEDLPEVLAAGAKLLLAMLADDEATAAAALAPDYQMIDHRPFGVSMSREEELAFSLTDGAGVSVVGERIRAESRTALTTFSYWTVDTDGAVFIGSESLLLTSSLDGVITRLEVFDRADLAEAHQRFDELTGSASTEPLAWNEADRLMRVFFDQLMDPSRDDWPDLVAPDFVEDDRRAVVGGGESRRDEYVRLWSGQQAAPGYDPTLETVATRGQGLILYRLTMLNDGVMTEFLQIDRWNEDGLMDREVRLDPDDADAAMAELNRLWFEGLIERRKFVARLGGLLGEAWVAPSTHPFDDLLTDDFELVDGRTLGMGSLDRDGFEAALRGREADGTTGAPVPSRVQFVSDDVMVFRANNLGHTPGSGIDWEEIASNVLVIDGDRIARLEMFDEDHWEEAAARAHDLSSPEPILVGNAATRWSSHTAGSRFGVADAFAGDFEREDRRTTVSGGVAGRAEVVESHGVMVEMGAESLSTPLAVRGDRLGLVRLSFDFDGRILDMLVVVEVAGDGRFRRTVQFDVDDLTGAQDELDGRYLTQLTDEQAATLRPGLRFRDAFSASGTDDLAAVMAPGFVAIDHRSMAWPELDHEGFLTANREREELLGPAVVFTTDIHRIEGDLVVASNRMMGTSPDSGAEWLQEFVNIFIVRGRLVHGLENFAADDLAAAMERAGELLRVGRYDRVEPQPGS